LTGSPGCSLEDNSGSSSPNLRLIQALHPGLSTIEVPSTGGCTTGFLTPEVPSLTAIASNSSSRSLGSCLRKRERTRGVHLVRVFRLFNTMLSPQREDPLAASNVSEEIQ